MSIELIDGSDNASTTDNTSLVLHGLLPRPYIDIVLERLTFLAVTPRGNWLAGNIPFNQLSPTSQGIAELIICDELACLIGLFIAEDIRTAICHKIVRYLKIIYKKISGIYNRECISCAINWFNNYRQGKPSLSPQILGANQRAVNTLTKLNQEPLARWTFNNRTYKDLNPDGSVDIHDLVDNMVAWRVHHLIMRVEIPSANRTNICNRLISELKHLLDWRITRTPSRQTILNTMVWLARYREGLLQL